MAHPTQEWQDAVALLEWETLETRRRLSACGAHFEHEFWQFWNSLSWQLITLLNKPYFSLLSANSVVR